jgi:hypothetical protein
MANVFGILTAIVLALSAFIAFKNKSQYEMTIADMKVKKDLLVISQARLTTSKGILDALPAEISGVNAEVEKLTAAEGAQQRANVALKEAAEAKTAKIAANKEKLDVIREKTNSIGNIQELASKMRTTNVELEELGQSITGAEAKLANLASQNTSSEAQVGAVKAKFESFAAGQSLASLKTRVRSIYPTWGFVTLASGNNAGVVANSTLNVMRGGAVIAKLLVTAVESSSSSASIVPDSLAPDATLMVGDSVEAAPKLVLKTPVTTAPALGN